MKRILPVILIFLLSSSLSYGAHIIGGEMRYTYVSQGISPNSKIYTITLILFRGDDPNGAPFAPSYVIGIFNHDNGQKVNGTAANNDWLITLASPPGIQAVPIILPSCIEAAPSLSYTYAIYSMNIELPDNVNGYTATYQTCCRINGMINVGNNTGSTYYCNIPGSDQLPTGNDSSPQFNAPINVICKNFPFTLNFSATDADPGDSLVYSLCNAYNGGLSTNSGFNDPAPGPYAPVTYNTPYTSLDPFGTGASIDPQTGIITGLAPDVGKYVVSVCIEVYRDHRRIGSHQKDLIVQVSDCNLTMANPMPNFVACDGFNVQFSHTSTGANTVFWDFGVASLIDDTSVISNPSYTYTDTGVYNVKFVINRGTSCADSVTRKIGVFPGFKPGFIATGSCFTNPYQFRDTTNPGFGFVNTWRWNFGDLSTLSDTSRIKTPQWTYNSSGTKFVTMIVTSSKGCIDSVQIPVGVLDKPVMTLAFKDTLICRPGDVQLNASGTGIFSWTPPVNIINANSSTPTVAPPVTTTYYVELGDNGCRSRDSVLVRVVDFVSLKAINDTTICQGDAIQLNANSDGLQFNWTPVANLDKSDIINPIAITIDTTRYFITARIGNCIANDFVDVFTVPYPRANAGSDPTICYNTSAQLKADIAGIRFTWTPNSYLDNPNILNPVSSPPRTTQYILSAYDTLGCPKPGRDTIVVFVSPRVRAFAGRDTTVVIGQPLHFNGTGGINYLWSPSTGLSNVNIFNPIGVYGPETDSVRYKLVVRDAANCADSAFLTVKVFKTRPYVFVPTAFTPNNDGLNDIISPIAVGIQKINYFSIYNRWGQLVFTTTTNGHGWDGRIGGTLQNNGVFVWMVSAIDYIGKPFFLKGTVALIR